MTRSIRQDIIRAQLKKGHIDLSPLGAVEILAALYLGESKHNPRKPELSTRDRVFFDNDELAPAIYSTLAHAGYFSKKDITSPNMPIKPNKTVHGIESSTGTLGQALSLAIGSALAAKIDEKNHTTYCIMGDGEHNLGQVWEALLFAAKHKLNNLIVIINRNNTQATGYTENVMPLESLRAKYEAFNWKVIETDGHNIQHIRESIQEAKHNRKPTAIIAHTTPGKGIKEFENRTGKVPISEKEAKQLIERLEK